MLNASLVKWLYQNGYRQKLIRIITGYNQPIISKIINSNKNIIPSVDDITLEQEIRKTVVDKILQLKILPTIGFSEQDKAYIKLLDYCLVDREKIRKMYYYISQYKISQVLRSKKIDKSNFNPTLLNITEEDFKMFLDSTF